MVANLDKKILAQLIKIILSHRDVEKIVIFGSRATKCFNKQSDIDIAIFGKNWTDRDINLTKDMLEEEISTPLKFDLVNFYSITKERLKKNIVRDGRTIYESGKN